MSPRCLPDVSQTPPRCLLDASQMKTNTNYSRDGARNKISMHSLVGSSWNFETRLFGIVAKCSNDREYMLWRIYLRKHSFGKVSDKVNEKHNYRNRSSTRAKSALPNGDSEAALGGGGNSRILQSTWFTISTQRFNVMYWRPQKLNNMQFAIKTNRFYKKRCYHVQHVQQ